MLVEKKQLLKTRIIWTTLFLFSILLLILLFKIDINSDYVLIFILRYLDIVFVAISFTYLISSMMFSYKEYSYENFNIIVYAGGYSHYIKINGEKYDEYNSSFSLVPIKLSCTLNDQIQVEVVISMSNKISLKINGKLLQPNNKK